MNITSKLFFIIFLVGLFNVQIIAQVNQVTESMVRNELQAKGISEAELIQAMKEKGIEIADLNNLTPEQIIQLEEIVKELESKNSGVDTTASPVLLDKSAFLEDTIPQVIMEINGENLEGYPTIKSIDDTIGKSIYGHDFFKNKNIDIFEIGSNVKAPPSYILGSGDKLIVSIWGLSQREFAFEINEEGYISVDLRRIFLKGLPLGEAKIKLQKWFATYYRFDSGEFEVALSYSRTVNVSIQGEVSNPGGYTLPAINSVFNALIVAGGPTELGSLREILHVKKDGKVNTLDFYAFLKNPNESANSAIEEGDVIIIPVAKQLVEIAGGVRRPMVYEIKTTEKLGDLIQLSGGFSKNANQNLIQINRFAQNRRILIDVNSQSINAFELIDGDIITVGVITAEADNFVTITGAVYNSGDFEKSDYFTLGDLVIKASIRPEARLDLVLLKRRLNNGEVIYLNVNISGGSEDLTMQLLKGDEVTIFSQSRYTDNQRFIISGAVRNPGTFEYAIGQSLSIKKAIEFAGGLRRDASGYGIIHTTDPLNPKVKKYERVNLMEAFGDEEIYQISALDSLEIFSKALFDEASSVQISGAVNNPGIFQYGAGMTLGDVLLMAGGFRLAAATNRIEVFRLVIEENEPTMTVIAALEVDRDILESNGNLDFKLQPYDEIMVRYVPDFEYQQIVELQGEVRFPGKYSLVKDNETIKDVIDRAGGLTLEAFPEAARLIRSEEDLGNVVLKLDEVLSNKNSRFNFNLKNGDVITIPKIKDFVSIGGATNAYELYAEDILGNQNQLNVPFHKGKSARFYINNYAGGISDDGSRNNVYVEHSNGEIVKSKNYVLYRSYPEVKKGSKIVVGYKPVKPESEGDDKKVDWSGVLNDAVAQAMSVLTLLLLLERL